MSTWIFFREINWNNDKLKQVHVDTRDFYASLLEEPSEKTPRSKDIAMRKGQYIFTTDEIKTMLERYYTDSGGGREWRFFALEHYKFWFKYIRILKIVDGWLVCGPDFKLLSKATLASKVLQGEDY